MISSPSCALSRVFFVCLFVCLFVFFFLLKGPGKRGHIVANTLLPTQMFPRFLAHATFVAETKKNNVSDFVQKHFVFATNVSQFVHGNKTLSLCPERLRPQETS